MPPSGKRVGATPGEAGVEFRVWAPGATSVDLTGEATGGARVAMTREADGHFATSVASARGGQRYHYVIRASTGEELSRLDPRGRQVDGTESVIVDPRSFAWQTTTWSPPRREDTVVYELHVASFARRGTDVGRFEDVAGKLDWLAGLGVNAIELMPVNGFSPSSPKGWGYGPWHYYAPHTAYGTPDDLRRLVDLAHARGIAVLLDVVYNHTSSNTPLKCFDAPCGLDNGIYFFSDPAYKATPWGPRPNFARREVADFFVDNVFSWLSEYRIDGFRWDSVSNVRAIDGQGTVPGGSELIRTSNAVTRKVAPGALLVAEDLKGWDGITKAAAAGGLGFDTQWEGGFYYPLAGVITPADDASRNVGTVRDALLGSYNGDPFQRLLFTENHDTVGNGGARLPSRIDPADPGSWAARKRSMLAAGLLFTTPGVPMLFMGQEMLARGTFESTPDPLDWTLAASHGPIVAFYRDMISLRKTSPGLRGAKVAVPHLNDQGGNKVIVYRRWAKGGDDVMVLVNLAKKTYAQYDIGLPAGGTWKVKIDSDDTRYSADFAGAQNGDVIAVATPRDGMPFMGSLKVGGYSVIVLEK